MPGQFSGPRGLQGLRRVLEPAKAEQGPTAHQRAARIGKAGFGQGGCLLQPPSGQGGARLLGCRLVNSRGGQEEGRKQGAGGNNSHSVTMPCIAVIGCLSSVGHWATGGL